MMHRNAFLRTISLMVLAGGIVLVGLSCSSGKKSTGGPPGVRIEPDDHSNTISGASVLNVGSSLGGQIETAGDVDFFRITLASSGTLVVYTTGAHDTVGTLYDSNGAELRVNDDADSRTLEDFNFKIEYPNASRGTYYVKVNAHPPEIASYTVFARLTPSTPTNRAPVKRGSIPGQTLTVGSSKTINVATYFTDPDGTSLSYTTGLSRSDVVAVSVSRAVVTLRAIAAGSATVRVIATDPDGRAVHQDFQVRVTRTNRAPVKRGSIPGQTLTVGSSKTINVATYFTDPDGTSLSYTTGLSRSDVVAVSVSRAVVTLRAIAAGSATVRVIATDPDGRAVHQDFQVRVTRTNRAPVKRGSIPGQTLTVGSSKTINVATYFTDPDGTSLSYTTGLSRSDVVAVSVSRAVVTLRAIAAGSATVRVIATDPDGRAVHQDFQVRVTRTNRAPVKRGSIPGQTLTVGSSKTINVATYFTDPDGTSLSYTTGLSRSDVVAVSVSRAVVTLRAIAAGSATVRVIATDPDGRAVHQDFQVRVTRTNRAPVKRGSIPGQTLTVGSSKTINVATYFTDPDGTSLSYTTGLSRSDVVAVSVSRAVVTLRAIAAGSATVRVIATDPDGRAVHQDFQVRVTRTNRAPVKRGSIQHHRVIVGQSIEFNVARYFTDPDGNSLSYTAESNSQAVTASLSGAVLTLRAIAVGGATVTMTATDPGGLSVPQYVNISVGPVYGALVVSAELEGNSCTYPNALVSGYSDRGSALKAAAKVCRDRGGRDCRSEVTFHKSVIFEGGYSGNYPLRCAAAAVGKPIRAYYPEERLVCPLVVLVASTKSSAESQALGRCSTCSLLVSRCAQ